jgi:hypothetical protein
MANHQRINDLLGRIWPNVEHRFGRGKIEGKLTADGQHIRVRVGGQDGELSLSDEAVEDYVQAPNERERQDRARDIEESLVRQIEALLNP